MTEHLSPELINDTPESLEPRLLTKSELDDMEAYVHALRETNATHNDMRAIVSELLVEKGHEPLADGEDRRTFQLETDGDVVEQTIFLDPSDFATFIVAAKDQIVTAETINNSIEDRLNRRLGRVAAAEASVSEEPMQTIEEAHEAALPLFEAFGSYVDTFHQTLSQLERVQRTGEAHYLVGGLMQEVRKLQDSFPHGITETDTRQQLTILSSILSDVQYRLSRLDQIVGEGGTQTQEYKGYVTNIQHHGLLGAMYDVRRKLQA